MSTTYTLTRQVSTAAELITEQPGRVLVAGDTSTARKLSALADAPGAVLLALSNEKGKLGAMAREGSSLVGLGGIIDAASHANYKPLATYLAAKLGETILIPNRGAFESMPDFFEMRVLNITSKKNGGYAANGKPTAALRTAMELKAFCTEVVAAAQARRAERDEARKQAEQEQQGADTPAQS